MELPKLLFMWREQYMRGGVGRFFFFPRKCMQIYMGLNFGISHGFDVLEFEEVYLDSNHHGASPIRNKTSC